MGLLGSLFKAAVSVALTPVAVVADVADVIDGNSPENTKDCIKSAITNTTEGVCELSKGKII